MYEVFKQVNNTLLKQMLTTQYEQFFKFSVDHVFDFCKFLFTDDEFQFVIRELITLSLDFVSNGNSLKEKDPDSYCNRIIKYSNIKKIKIRKKKYKTIFPFDLSKEELTQMEFYRNPKTIEGNHFYLL